MIQFIVVSVMYPLIQRDFYRINLQSMLWREGLCLAVTSLYYIIQVKGMLEDRVTRGWAQMCLWFFLEIPINQLLVTFWYLRSDLRCTFMKTTSSGFFFLVFLPFFSYIYYAKKNSWFSRFILYLESSVICWIRGDAAVPLVSLSKFIQILSFI